MAEYRILRVAGPTFCAGAICWFDGNRLWWGATAPYLYRIIGKMTPDQFLQFLDGTGKRVGLSYEWV